MSPLAMFGLGLFLVVIGYALFIFITDDDPYDEYRPIWDYSPIWDNSDNSDKSNQANDPNSSSHRVVNNEEND